MVLTDEQKKVVAGWVAAGDNLSAIQRKLTDQFKVSMTYMDVRFLVDDLNLQLKDAPPKADTNLKGGAAGAQAAGQADDRPGKKGFFDKAKEKLGLAKEEPPPHEDDEDIADEEDFEELEPAGSARVSVSVDKVTLIPGAVVSGTVTFSDGVTGKWIVDNYGRPGFTEISKPDYRPSPADSQSFVQELGRALKQRGF
ncbi:MAG: hypothetical protein ABSA05_09805 [Opitutaceae bacterium]|jgi:hypothetical protein